MNRKSALKSVFNTFVKRITYFGRNSSVQGLKYVFQENGTAITRSIWLLLLLIFTGCLYLLLVPVIQRGGSVSVTPNTRYLNWNTTFPGVTVCEEYIPKIVENEMLTKYPDFLSSFNLDYRRHIADRLYGRGSCSLPCLPCGNLVPCNVTWRSMIEYIHKQCNELIADCHFNNKEFSCCKYFYTVDSEYGTCYSFNSLQGSNFGDHQFYVNSSTRPGVLSFRLLSDAQISVHSSEELSTNVLDKKFRFDVKTHVDKVVNYFFSMIEVENEPALEKEDVNTRRCRYGFEIPDLPFHTYQVYSYGQCRLAQSTKKSFDYCGCVHPVRDIRYKDYYCNYTGMNCLIRYEVQKTKLGKTDNPNAEDCLPSCMESELSTVHLSKRRQPQGQYDGALVNIRMVSLPTLRYQKSLLRTNLDLVVTVGGMAGLFFSASILSLAEVFYLILRSPDE